MTMTGSARGSYAKTPGRRREIIEAGIEVFSTSGFRKGSIREVAEQVGMSQAGLLHHFSNKNELLAAVLELRDDIARARVRIDQVPGIGMIRGVIDLVDYNASVPGLVSLYCVLSAEATSPDHPAYAYFRNRYEWTVGLISESLTAMKQAGELIDGAEPGEIAKMLVALMDGLQVQWLMDPTSVDMAAYVRHYMQTQMTVAL